MPFIGFIDDQTCNGEKQIFRKKMVRPIYNNLTILSINSILRQFSVYATMVDHVCNYQKSHIFNMEYFGYF